MNFWAYMLRCADGSYYVGHTEDIDQRVWQHQTGAMRGYTHSRRPLELVWSEAFSARADAISTEYRLKKWSRAKKEAFLAENWQRLKRLAIPPGERAARTNGLDFARHSPSSSLGKAGLAGESKPDARFMAAAIVLSERGRALTTPNPNVGCIIEKHGRVIGRGWTQPGGRPHAEAMALAQTGEDACGATAWVSLEPCAHNSERGPACADLLIEAGIARLVIAAADPDPRTDGQGIERLRSAGIAVETGIMDAEARTAMAGWFRRQTRGRPFVTLKLATSLDGCIAMANGESRWITGEPARAHAHLERARSNAILVGRGTWEADTPKLDVRLPGLERRSPQTMILSENGVISPSAAMKVEGVDWLLVEGGAQTAASFLRENLVDRLMLYRAPILIGGGKAALGDVGLESLDAAHGKWRRSDSRMLGSDTLDVYEAI